MRFLIKFIFVLFLAGITAVGGAWWWTNQALRLSAPVVEFRIPAGSSLRAAINLMQESGIALQPTLFTLLAKWQRADTAIKAGSYAIKADTSPWHLLLKLTRGEVTQGELTLVEGWTFRQWRTRMDLNPDLRHETLGLTEADIAARLGISASQIEGLLFPDTYLFDKQSSDLELLARAQRTQQQRLASEWQKRAPNLPYKTPQEALVMASIIEKETGRESDRTQVAAVFVNRLRSGMLLQTDPTVIYGLGETFDGNLRKRDLQSDTPYNTYTRAGLPPTPIAMPGLASLQAALHPAPVEIYYFVARGDGSSQFSRTLEEHNRAVNKYQRGGK